MVTAVDSSVIFDYITRDAEFGVASRQALEASAAAGRVLVCDVAWAEIAACFRSGESVREMFDELGIEYSPIEVEAAIEAGTAWRTYRRQGGPRSRIAADFLIGAHALHQADRLLTLDRGFYRMYFKKLSVLDPSTL